MAQHFQSEHDAECCWGCQGKACDGEAWAHSVMVMSENGRGEAAASLLLWAKFHQHVEHDHMF